ncbi:hypothetical protein VFPFJ_02349 [Purpureocillium lilacinum]|uniref:Uncharacterized protein n=1 Tax=Purpureocillium lilacinum TaxID=33203 RepID=A0A179HUK8_PURLI|nr:hypothetical protein VFPFJ_02349 [Purpureocillium lilacinum]OAQ79057.1 hypothetical protein VFPBJ_07178 [Purpureocillium lilacinum]OAQ93188.1 hypothetical protein VFPFJ_02349 [Purpureocillium lilacinum]GJN71669.1 hypothetical protein PLICBS_005737 [Purpureocillium lilacinum]
MPGVFSQLLSGSSLKDDSNWGLGGGGGGGAPSGPTHVFSLGSARGGSSINATSIRPAGYPPTAPPLYTFTGAPHAKPNMALYYGEASPANLVGEGKLSSFSSTSQMRVRGMPFTLRMSQMSGSITLESPVTGKMKLKPNPMTGTGLGMYDASGNKVAKIRSGGGFGDKQLEIYVPGDGMFIEVVLLSFMTAKMLNKIVGDAVGEAVSSVVTA